MVRAELEGGNDVLALRLGRHHDHGHAFIVLLDPLEQLYTVHARHPDVTQRQRTGVNLQLLQRLGAV